MLCSSVVHEVSLQEGKDRRLQTWTTKTKEGVVSAVSTPLHIYDAKAQELSDRNLLIGRGSGGPNIGYRLKLVNSYIQGKLGIDHNNKKDVVPDD